jgi:hypothetical protein
MKSKQDNLPAASSSLDLPLRLSWAATDGRTTRPAAASSIGRPLRPGRAATGGRYQTCCCRLTRPAPAARPGGDGRTDYQTCCSCSAASLGRLPAARPGGDGLTDLDWISDYQTCCCCCARPAPTARPGGDDGWTTRPAAASSLAWLPCGPAGRRRTDGLGLPDLLLLPRSATSACPCGPARLRRMDGLPDPLLLLRSTDPLRPGQAGPTTRMDGLPQLLPVQAAGLAAPLPVRPGQPDDSDRQASTAPAAISLPCRRQLGRTSSPRLTVSPLAPSTPPDGLPCWSLLGGILGWSLQSAPPPNHPYRPQMPNHSMGPQPTSTPAPLMGDPFPSPVRPLPSLLLP